MGKKYYCALLILLLFFSIFLLITFNTYISYYDEALYIMLGKSLAKGYGYTSINLPGNYPHVISPIIFPFIISIFWKVFPVFPSNLILMKLFQIMLYIISIYITYRYIIKFHFLSPALSLGIVCVAFLYQFSIFSARVVITEIPYYLSSLLAIYSFRKYEKAKDRYLFLLSCFFITLSFGIRVAGITLAMAVAAYLFLKQRWKAFTLLSIFFMGITVLYMTNIKLLTSAFDKDNILLNYYTGYKSLFDIKHINNLLNIITQNLKEFTMLLLQTILPYITYIKAGPILSLCIMIFLFLITSGIFTIGYLSDFKKNITLENIYTGIYLFLIIVDPSPLYRYIIPIMPFICLYYFKLLKLIPAKIIGTSLLITLMLPTIIYRTWQDISSHKIFLQNHAYITNEIEKASAWLTKNSEEDDLIACRFDPIFYLYSGRKAILTYPYLIFAYDVYYNYNPDESINENIDNVIDGLKKLNAKFLILEEFLVGGYEGYYSNKLILSIINHLGEKCKPVYANNEGSLFIFKIDW